MLALGDETRLRGMLFWLMGDLSFAPFSPVALCLLLVVGGLAIAGARSLNVLARGEIESQSLGVALSPARIALVLRHRRADRHGRHHGRRHRLHRSGHTASGTAGRGQQSPHRRAGVHTAGGHIC